MGKSINIVDEENNLIASVSSNDVILAKGYQVVEANHDEPFLRDEGKTIKVFRPEGSI